MAGNTLYEVAGATFVPQRVLTSPWDKRGQQDCGPMALLAEHARRAASPGFDIVRFTVDVLQRAPMVPLIVRSERRHTSDDVEHIRTVACAQRRLVARATALAIRQQAVDLGRGEDAGQGGRAAGSALPFPGSPTAAEAGPLQVEFVSGDGGPGPATVWARLTRDLLPGQPTHPFVALAAVAEIANRIAGPLDVERFTFVNPDTTLHLHRQPVGPWIGLQAESVATENGLGSTSAVVSDQDGVIGILVQSLVVRSRLPLRTRRAP